MKLLSIVLLALVGIAGQTRAEDRPIHIEHAVEMEFETETNKIYRLQGSDDLQHWEDVADPVFGSGRRQRRLGSTRNDDGSRSNKFFRVVVEPGTNTTLAPWSFSGATVQLGDDLVPERLRFMTETNGQKVEGIETDSFSYLFTKTGDNEVQTEVRFANGRTNTYTFTYSAGDRGTYLSEEVRRGRVKNREAGLFLMVSSNAPSGGMTNPPPTSTAGTNTVPTSRPDALGGLVYLFQSDATPERYDFVGATDGIKQEDNERPGDDNPAKPFTYVYTLGASNTASLILTFVDGRRSEFDLAFTSGGSGKFVQRKFRNGVLKRTDTGFFSPSALSVGQTSTGGVVAGTPSVALTGETYTFLSGTPPEVLAFQTSSTGLQTDDSDPGSFSYTYSVTDAHSARIVVTFKPGKWDEYVVNFTGANGGSFVRKEFRNNLLNDTDSASFVRTPAH